MDRAMKSGRRRLSFFKVMVGDFQMKMCIPRGFIKNFNGNTPKKIMLRSSTGRSWTVSVIEIGDDLFLCNEWWSFANDHTLEYGDFLIFEYNSHADFTVKIFTRTFCAKKIPLVKKSTNSTNIHPQIQRCRTKARNSREILPGKMITPVDIVGAHPCDNPNCTIVMRPTYLDTMWPFVALPATFAGRYLGESPLNVTLHNSDDNVWHVQYSAGTQYRLGKGWKAFVLDNHLKLQDIYRFELLAKSFGHADLKVSLIGHCSTA